MAITIFTFLGAPILFSPTVLVKKKSILNYWCNSKKFFFAFSLLPLKAIAIGGLNREEAMNQCNNKKSKEVKSDNICYRKYEKQ